MQTKAIYAGSFDPITRGHLDIIKQGLGVFDTIVITIGFNPAKPQRYFPLETSMEMIAEACREYGIDEDRIEIGNFSGAQVHYAEQQGATALLRGFRQVSDFDSEFRLNGINASVSDLPQVYMICHTEFLHIASSTVKEMWTYGLPIEKYVTPCVIRAFEDSR